MQTFTEPGRGRKQCPCGKYVGVRTVVCSCGHQFGPVKAKPPKEEQPKVEPPMKAEMPKKASSPPVKTEEPPLETGRPAEEGPVGVLPAQPVKAVGLSSLQVICIPGQSPQSKQPFCPAKPSGEWPHTDDEVRSWVEEVIAGGIAQGRLYLDEAVCYFAGAFWAYSMSGQEWRRAREIIKDHIPIVMAQYGHRTEPVG